MDNFNPLVIIAGVSLAVVNVWIDFYISPGGQEH